MYEVFTTDADLERNGVVIDYGTFRVTLARAGGANKSFQRVLEARSQPFRRMIATETMPRERAEELMQEVYAESVIKNWEVQRKHGNSPDPKWVVGLDDPSGAEKPVPFNKKSVMAALKALPNLWADLQEQSNRMVLYRNLVLEDDAGN